MNPIQNSITAKETYEKQLKLLCQKSTKSMDNRLLAVIEKRVTIWKCKGFQELSCVICSFTGVE